MWGKGRQFRARCFAHISSLPHGTQVKNGTKGGPPFGVTSVPTSPHEHERAEQKGGPPFVPTSRTRCKGAVLLGVFGLFGSGPPFGVTQKEGLLLGKRWASFWGDSNGEPPCRVTSSCDTLPKYARALEELVDPEQRAWNRETNPNGDYNSCEDWAQLWDWRSHGWEWC